MTEPASKDNFIAIETVHFVDREMQKERVLTQEKLERLREVLEDRFHMLDKAQNIAYVELQRRLDTLNHAHEEAKHKESHFMPRENFEQFFKDFGVWRDTVDKFQSNLNGRIAVLVGAVGIILFL